MPVTYGLTMYAYCGMSVPLITRDEQEDRETVRAYAARYIRRARKSGNKVNVLEPGTKWEIETPDDAFMVSDNEGTLSLVEFKPATRKCFDCGFDVEIGESCDCQTFDASDADDANAPNSPSAPSDNAIVGGTL